MGAAPSDATAAIPERRVTTEAQSSQGHKTLSLAFRCELFCASVVKNDPKSIMNKRHCLITLRSSGLRCYTTTRSFSPRRNASTFSAT